MIKRNNSKLDHDMKNNFLLNHSQRNYFDNTIVDILRLYKDFPFNVKQPKVNSPIFGLFNKIYRNPLIPLHYRSYIWHFLRRLNLDLTWFEEFKSYWSNVLGCRPLWCVYDFFFLANVYRIRFQNIRICEAGDSQKHLEVWQSPELLYQLFHMILKEAVHNETKILKILRRYKRLSNVAMLEFGCGTAPITKTLFDFERVSGKAQIYISDIQTVAFHYACYRFRDQKNVIPNLLTPENNFTLSIKRSFDVVFCMTVFEHLPNPLKTIKMFYQVLEKEGLLFFDYIKSEGSGLDTKQGYRERGEVIDFIENNFDLLYGNFSKESSMMLTVVRKK